MPSRKRHAPVASGNRADYRQAFLGHVHKLLHAGYAALTPTDFSTAEEDDITGELCKHMKHLTEIAPSAPWMARYSIHDQDPVNDAKRATDGQVRRGKRRPRLDIRIVNKARIPNASFSIEAKRLHHGGSAADYLDDEGLDAFVQEYYAKDDDACGMLGYVQKRNVTAWLETLHERLLKHPSVQPLANGNAWCRTLGSPGGAKVYLSRHLRSKSGRSIDIFHTLLDFTAPTEASGQG